MRRPKLTYDRESGCIYVQLKRSKIATTTRLTGRGSMVIIDRDKNGLLIGVEIIPA